jgi:hypothetical protein
MITTSIIKRLAILIFSFGILKAQVPTDLPLDLPAMEVERVTKSGNTDFFIKKINKLLQDNPEEVLAYAQRTGLIFKGNEFLVTIINRNGGERPVSEEIIAAAGGRLSMASHHACDVWIPASGFEALAKSLPGDYYMRLTCPADFNDFEGPRDSVANTQDYKANGADGSGRSVAVIDNFYWNLDANQIIPGTVDSINLNPSAGGFLDTLNTNPHGGACFERVFDHAPGARYYLVHAPSTTQKIASFDSAVAWNVDVISLSQSTNQTGWDDGSGWFCDAVKKAADDGILVFCSAGNKANGHWQGNYKDSDNDNWHEWGNGVNELNSYTLPGDGGRPSSTTIWLQWEINQVADSNAYRLSLLRWNGASWDFVASDNTGSDGWSRRVSYTQVDSSVGETLAVAVQHIGTTSPQFEIIGSIPLDRTFSINHPNGSTTSPSNLNHSYVIPIGGVDWDNYQGGNGTTGVVTLYSSQGPSNGGSMKPGFAGPTRTGGFVGTSCSTPESARIALAFWSSLPGYHPMGLLYLLRAKALMYKDWGQAGPDNVYGFGGIHLYDYAPRRVYLDSRYSSNPNGLFNRPQSKFDRACTQVQFGGEILILGQDYLLQGNLPYLTNTLFNKDYKIVSARQYNATIGY